MTQLSTLIQGSGKNAIDKRSYIATSGQTAFTVTYSPPYVDVYQNGVRLNVVDYTATSGTSVTLTVGAAVNDEIEVIGFSSDASITASFSGPNAPTIPIEGMMWYDTTDGSLYVRTGNFWVEASQAGATQGIQGIQGPPGDGVVISGITVTDASYANTDDTAVSLTGGYIKVTGTGFVSGCTIVVGNVIATSVTFISSTEVRAQLPALAAGTYVLYVSNPSGAVAIRVNAITFSALPTWVSTSPLPNGKLNTAISIQLSGTSDSAVVYALQSGSTLPAGVTLSSSGLLSGTVTGITTDTTYNFTVVATDVELQDSPKAFSITITVLYAVARSLRFRAAGANTGVTTAYLTRTPASATNQKTWTWSSWIKFGALTNTYAQLMDVGSGNGGQNRGYIQFTNNTLDVAFNPTGSSWSINLASTAVYRDPAAWYHIVVMADTTQATNTDRLKMYVNGQQVTSLATSLYPLLNDNLSFNTTAAHYIGRTANSIGQFDGQMAEINFVDGQALTPASFGEVAVTSGAWVPKAYAGTYGTNGFYLPFSGGTATSYAGSFNGSSQYISVTPNTSLQFGSGDFTIECWVYKSANGSTYDGICQLGTNSSGNDGFYLIASSTATGYEFGSQGVAICSYNGSIRDSQWHHIAVSRTGTTTRMFIDGVQRSSYGSTYTIPSTATVFTSGVFSSSYYYLGYISNLRLIKGTGLYTANFIPPTTALTAITNTSLLTLQNATIVDNSSNGYTVVNNNTVVTSVQSPFLNPTILTADSSGNANNWTTNNISLTGGSTYDSLLDSPVPSSATLGNYCVLNPLIKIGSSVVIQDSNLTFTKSGATYYNYTYGTIGVSSGKYYWEVTQGSTTDLMVGVTNSLYSENPLGNNPPGSTINGYMCMAYNGNKYNNATATAYGATFLTANDVVGIALDMDAKTLTFYKNGVSQGIAFSSLPAGTYFPVVSDQGSQITLAYANFGQRPFAYTPPAGFLALNTFNLPASAVPNPATAMAATTYTGTGVARSISNAVNTVSMQPNFVWIKRRDGANYHVLTDSVRGVLKEIYTNVTTAEATLTTYGVNAFNSDGFSLLGAGSDYNANAGTFVAWQWKAGGAVSANNNTTGTITSTVSANQAAGFSVVTFTGNGVDTLSGVATVGHGLSVTPSFIITKKRSSGTDYNWSTYHISNGNANIWLNSTSAKNPGNWVTAPAATVFTPPVSLYGNESGVNYVAYCWAPVAGYSAFGKYTGNGSADGAFVYTGFKPRYVLIKCSSAAGSWFINDTAREPYNLMNVSMRAETSDTEASGGGLAMDALSNGFKMRDNGSGSNGSGVTYIYAAFAESAFNFATAR